MSASDPRGKTPKSASTHESRSSELRQVCPALDLTKMVFRGEDSLTQQVTADKDLCDRLSALVKEFESARSATYVDMMTNGFQVDEVITPKLHRLTELLCQVLRVSVPIDVFICPLQDHNAFCHPSRRGNRYILGIHAGLLRALSTRELLFVMGHEVGHAAMQHGELPIIGFNDPRFSWMEAIQLRRLSRAREITCDRIGLLACQDVRAASKALFKIATGLDERWASFDEAEYAEYFDRLAQTAELPYLDDGTRTHPLAPLRVKALMCFSESEAYAAAFAREDWKVSSRQLEAGVEAMLSVLTPDLSDLLTVDQKAAVGNFLFGGALLMIAADGLVEPAELDWLQHVAKFSGSSEDLKVELAHPEFRDRQMEAVSAASAVLRRLLPEVQRAGLLRSLYEIASAAGGIPHSESALLEELCQWLAIRPQIASTVLQRAGIPKSIADESPESHPPADSPHDEDSPIKPASEPPAPLPAIESLPKSSTPLDRIVQSVRLKPVAAHQVREICKQINQQDLPVGVAVRSFVSWVISSAGKRRVLEATEGTQLILAALEVGRLLHGESFERRVDFAPPLHARLERHGPVVLFHKDERVQRHDYAGSWVVMALAPATAEVVVHPAGKIANVEFVQPNELIKDPVNGIWPRELAEI